VKDGRIRDRGGMHATLQARLRTEMMLEVQRMAAHELVSVADIVRAALAEKIAREREGQGKEK